MFSGANAALKSARVTGRIPGISARSLARRAIAVGADVPLAEALRQAQEAQATGLVVVDAAGRPTAVAQQAAVAAVPVERRPWVPVSSVAAALDPRAVLPADLAGDGPAPGDAGRAVGAVPRRRGRRRPGRESCRPADVESALSGTQRS